MHVAALCSPRWGKAVCEINKAGVEPGPAGR
jgi:hypothetical protein